MPAQMTLSAITLDCADPLALAAFYRQATGFEPHPKSDADFAGLTAPDGLFLAFQRVPGYRAPNWPEQSVPQQLHVDFAVDDLDATEADLLRLGAAKPPQHGDQNRSRVLTDPAGHPFCLVRREEG